MTIAFPSGAPATGGHGSVDGHAGLEDSKRSAQQLNLTQALQHCMKKPPRESQSPKMNPTMSMSMSSCTFLQTPSRPKPQTSKVASAARSG